MSKGKHLRDTGIQKVSSSREIWLDQARELAIDIINRRGMVSINDVRNYLALPTGAHPNLWVAVLRGKVFEPIGYTQASHPLSHARAIRIYKLKEGEQK